MPATNVVLILADDLGYSDIGCYGGEIRTPNLDRLGRGGVRLAQFFNTARCSPSRASLLTGLHPHQTGIGILTEDDGPRGYRGSINDRCATLAELLSANGYATGLSGKWHLSHGTREPDDSWPTRRGFEHFFGTIAGAGSYYQPGTLHRGEQDATAETREPGFFYTDAIAQDAAGFIDEQAGAGRPFFSYVAFTAPHWPLHASEEDIAEYDGVYEAGWDALRAARLERQKAEGLVAADAQLSDRDPSVPPWAETPDAAWEARRMRTYAAQVQRLDRGVGRVIDALERNGVLDDTLVVFLADNGACAEVLPPNDPQLAYRRDIVPERARDGRPIRVGNDPSIDPGPDDTYSSYGVGWANLSNTPFRLYKRWVHEGGIATPFIVHWPAGELPAGSIAQAPFQLVDFVPTILELTGAEYRGPAGRAVLPLEGRSMLAALRGADVPPAVMHWEHIGNGAVRRGDLKLVREHGRPWELYDLSAGRIESDDLAAERPELLAELVAEYETWAQRVGVIPREQILEIHAERGRPPDTVDVASQRDRG